jgi:hypothetical protein
MGENVISPELLAAALEELDTGVRMTVQHSCNMFRARRMSVDDLLLLLRSFAWQSPTLKAWFHDTEEEIANKRRQVVHEGEEILSLDDIRSLMESEAPLKKSRLHESWADANKMPTFGTHASEHDGNLSDADKAQESSASSASMVTSQEVDDVPDLPSAIRPLQGEDSAARQARGMRKSISWSRFEKLSICAPSDEEDNWDADEASATGLSCSERFCGSGLGVPRSKSENYNKAESFESTVLTLLDDCHPITS